MVEGNEFAHGVLYGDDSGVIFYGPPVGGSWTDRLDVSDRFIDPLFRAVLDRMAIEGGGEVVPRLATEWNTLEGWAAIGAGIFEIPRPHAVALIATFAKVTAVDVAPHVAGATAEECLRCAAAISNFIGSRLARGVSVYIEDD